MEPTIESFTVSHSFETNLTGKASHFLSVNFKMPTPVSMEEFKLVHASAAKYVSTCVIQEALMRGMITREDVLERVQVLNSNFEQYKTSLDKRLKVENEQR